jgi:hypothetical protein
MLSGAEGRVAGDLIPHRVLPAVALHVRIAAGRVGRRRPNAVIPPAVSLARQAADKTGQQR